MCIYTSIKEGNQLPNLILFRNHAVTFCRVDSCVILSCARLVLHTYKFIPSIKKNQNISFRYAVYLKPFFQKLSFFIGTLFPIPVLQTANL
jgi:hypothetical protein